jgi:hypothetical protein
MTHLLIQILVAGGLLVKTVLMLVLRVLPVPLAGLIAGIYVVRVLFQMLGDKDYRKNLFVPESDKQGLSIGNG